MPTIVHTLVSPISTCHSAPDIALPSPPACRLPDEPADAGRRRVLPDALPLAAIPPALDVLRLPFFTRPPSFDGKSSGFGTGDAGALVACPCPLCGK